MPQNTSFQLTESYGKYTAVTYSCPSCGSYIDLAELITGATCPECRVGLAVEVETHPAGSD